MTILITGGTGLVGARLLPRLAAAGLDCRALLRAGKPAPSGVTAIEADLLDPATLEQAVEGVSAIVHLAAVFRTPDTDLIWKSNLEGTRNLIAVAEKHAPGARFIMASTSNIYDADSPRPGREDDDADPKQAYPASKLAAENVLRDSRLTWAILRFGFVYGDGDGHLEDLPRHAPRLNMHPAKRMSLVHHRDIATAVRLALTGAMDGHIVNIADDAPTSIYELVELAGGTMEPSSAPLDNPWHLHVDASLARRLGFHPTVRSIHQAVEEGLM
ncbi:epimerase [Pleomorphomonas diazotrophica]|uniref:Epimerase n=1 Tax=Pleomorphomonas diazotrophica TaxID=1166257 RepID=A0A1I4V9U8_9HYPH|nr:NAD(P)-dependent oxidoreductase [Pleomorphomonas diazotrophica]PKR87326.1 epimerase [Pleomorphomonas diazotrophica]SFM97969.1 Nucleoside-diphosphate-sugar epimerase [Pleomorphomonas diazotrophica]